MSRLLLGQDTTTPVTIQNNGVAKDVATDATAAQPLVPPAVVKPPFEETPPAATYEQEAARKKAAVIMKTAKPEAEVEAAEKPERAEAEAEAVVKWQKSLRLFMAGIVVFSFLLFGMSFFSVRGLWHEASQNHDLQIDFAGFTRSSTGGAATTQFRADDKPEYTEWATRTLLENNIVERRYNQAKLTLMTRTWVSYMGFITGMILALVGATFILGKLNDSGTQVGGKAGVGAGNVEGNLQSASPGIVLAFLGTALMILTLYTDHKIEMTDVSTYLPTQTYQVTPGSSDPPPVFPAEPDANKKQEMSPEDQQRQRDLEALRSGAPKGSGTRGANP